MCPGRLLSRLGQAQPRGKFVPLFLRKLLADPSLGLQLVAGATGLDRRGAVRWAHISEIPDPTPWLEGGELLLTTGLAIASSETLQRRLVAGLDARGCPGVGFGLGVVCDDVPAALVDEAERRRLPLFTVPYEVPFLAVTKRVSSEIFDEHYAALRDAVDLQRSVLAAVLADAGAQGVLATVARAMPELDCVLFDYYGQVLAERGATDGGVQASKLWAGLGGIGTRRDRFDTELDGRNVHAGVVRLADTAEAVLVVLADRALHEHELLMFEQAVTGVSLELARGLSVREARRGRVDDLLSEVAEHRIGQQALTRSLARLGMDPTAPYRVLCLRTAPPRAGDRRPPGERNVSTLVEDVLTDGDRVPLLGRYDGLLYCVVAPPDGDQGQRVHDALQSRGWSQVCIGRSRPKRGCDHLGAALLEAAAASAALQTGVTDVDALGLRGLLAGLSGDLAAGAYVERVLGPVLAHDARAGLDGGSLLSTLRAYLRHGCRPGPAAAELGVHRHTLAYRLDRVATLTGRSLREGSNLLEVGLALELHDAAAGSA